MHKLSCPSTPNLLLGAVCIAVIAVAYSSVGSAAQSSSGTRRTVTVERGVVQSTVSGSGTVSSSSELDVGFSTAGAVTHIYVNEAQHVEKGELIATLDPASAEIALEQARATLLTAESNLAKEVETDGETTTSSTGSGTSTQTGSTASAASVRDADETALPASSGDRIAVSAQNTEAAATPATTTTPATTSTPTKTSTKTTTTPSSSSQSKSTETTKSTGASSSSTSSSSTASSSTVSAAQREANLVFAKSSVRSDTLAVKSAETALQNTRLDAPQEGTIISLSGTVGETVTASGTTKVSTATTTSSSTTGSTGGQSAGSSSSAASSGSSSTSSFAVISNLRSMQVVVPLGESEIANVHTGQPATVSIEALNGKKLAAEVTSVAATSTSSSGVVTYDVTFHLNQLAAGLKAGMSATAEVVINQAEGLNVLTSAISNGSVTVVRGGKDVSQAVTTGLAGNTTTIILSGLTAGETVALPSTKTTGTSSSSAKGSSSSGSLGSSALGGSSGGGSEGPPSGGGGPPGGGGAP